MRLVLVIFLFAAYSLGIIQVGASIAYGNVTKVVVTHTHHFHDHQEGHDHHRHDEDGPTEADERVPEDAAKTHSHEVYVGGSNSYFLNSATPTVQSFLLGTAAHPMIEHRPPVDIGLGSIFRPPIA